MIRADMTKMTKTKRAAYKAAVDKAVDRCLRSPRHSHRPFDCVVEELHGRGNHGTPPTAEQSKIMETAVHKNKGRVHHATRAVEPDRTSATELKMFIDNDYALHKQQGVLIQKNLATKKVRSLYKHDLAVKAFGYLVESGAKKYAKAFSVGTDWHTMFDVPTRKLVAEELASDFERDFEVGQYDELLPKKYQKELSKKHLVPPHHRAHASKKVSWKLPESLKVTWSPTNQAYFALWPGRGPVKDQQVLKVASAEDMHGWLRDTYGDAYGIAGRTDRQDHARKKSKTQLDREISHVVPSWRAGR